MRSPPAPRRPRRLRRFLKWTGAFVCALLLSVWTANAFWRFGYTWSSPNSLIAFRIDAGCLCFDHSVGEDEIRNLRNSIGHYPAGGWSLRGGWLDGNRSWMPAAGSDGWLAIIGNTYFGLAKSYTLPIWIPLSLLTVPTLFLFIRDRRRIPPGHCTNCGYDLTGNVSGVCPECGNRIVREADCSPATPFESKEP